MATFPILFQFFFFLSEFHNGKCSLTSSFSFQLVILLLLSLFMFKSPIRLPAHGMPISRFEFEQQVVAFEIIIHTRRFMHIWKGPCNTLVFSLLCVFFRHPPRTITTMILVFTLNDARLQDYTVTLAAYSGGSGKGIALTILIFK